MWENLSSDHGKNERLQTPGSSPRSNTWREKGEGKASVELKEETLEPAVEMLKTKAKELIPELKDISVKMPKPKKGNEKE